MVAPVAPSRQQEREQEDGAAYTKSHVSNNTKPSGTLINATLVQCQPGRAQ
jgi:hypothetical protein